jgi:ATP-dependent Clp protease ATP-binding subunit ClpB
VILLDEIEKAHRDVFNVLLQVLDDGRLTDGHGRTVDFRNTIVVMTSNLGSDRIQEMAGQSYDAIKAAVMDVLRHQFRPEFINRIDETVVFHALGREHLRRIVDIQIGGLEARLAERDMRIAFDDAALDWLANVGFDPVYGARPLKRAIQQHVENALARDILAGKVHDGDNIAVSAADGGLVFAQHASAAPTCRGRLLP